MVIIAIFLIALLGIIFVLLNKKREMETGKPYLNLAFGSDFHMKEKIANAKASVKGMPKRAAHVTAFYAVKHGMTAFAKAKAVIHPKIVHIIDAVKGKGIPESRGSVSPFLKQMKDRGSDLK